MEKISVSNQVIKEYHGSEAFKTLRTNLMFSGAEMKCIGLTSFSSADGKSSISFQLAASLAQMGKRVILLDTDLRKSVMASRLRIRGKSLGLSHFLSGMANADEILTETDVPGLFIMLAGTRVPNASELLGSKNFARLIKALKESFDYVIVDAAPIGQVIDCAVMAPALDGVLMVVNVENNSAKLIRRMKAQLEKVDAKILGVVLNRVDLSDRHGYYGKAYSKYYGQANGTYNTEEKK